MTTSNALPVLRVGRPVPDVAAAAELYCAGLEWSILAEFHDHEGFDGVIIGVPGGAYHLEFTSCRHHPVQPSPTPEDLLVLYLPDKTEWQNRCDAMVSAGFSPVESFNPYWDVDGRTFVDSYGYRTVIQGRAWS